MDERRRGVSRRGLFGVFGRGVRGLSEGLSETAKELGPQKKTEAPAEPPPSYDRILRPDEECAEGRPDGFQAYRVDREAETIEPGSSLCVRGGQLPEPIIVVRVHETHLAACSAECGVDGSEVVWSGEEDRLLCPSCGTRWRLDGEPMSGPAAVRLASFSVEREPGGLRITAWD